tara:strand:- start:362 stop:913 length:552 start_codon:yes stop_codon:yes gene_type:complete
MTTPYIRHVLVNDCFYRRKYDDSSITKIEPKEGYIYSIDEKNNKIWFYNMLDILNKSEYSVSSQYVKHTLRYKYFYCKPNDDESLTLVKPKEGYFKRKEEDLENIQWFNDRWDMLNKSEFNLKSPYIKHILNNNVFYRKKGDDSSITLYKQREGFCKKKDEKDNTKWFNERWNYLNKTYNFIT